MIIQEQYKLNGVDFTRTFSNTGKYVTRDGEEYEEANDPTEYGRVYKESENTIPFISNDESTNKVESKGGLDPDEAWKIISSSNISKEDKEKIYKYIYAKEELK